MKKIILFAMFASSVSFSGIFAQEISQRNVPSVILNKFQQEYPKALDIDWKKEADLYKVDFEIGSRRTDHDVWYNNEGKVVKHKKEIAKRDLPAAVLAKIKADFSGYRISDIKQITEAGKSIYTLELNKLTKEWKMTFDASGNILDQIAD